MDPAPLSTANYPPAPPPEAIPPQPPAAATPNHLSPDVAKKVLVADLANIFKKAKSGRPLTKYERGLIDSEAKKEPLADPPAPPAGDPRPATNEPEWANSYEQLGEIFGLHRASFPRIIRNHQEDPDLPTPRANGQHSVACWRAFFEKHSEIRRQAQEPTPAKADLEIGILLQKLRQLRHDNDVKEDQYVEKASLLDTLTRVAAEQREILRSELEGALVTRLGAMNTEERRAELRRVVDDICCRMARLVDSIDILGNEALELPKEEKPEQCASEQP